MSNTYFCTKCGRKHKSGKYYEPHKKYEKKEEDDIPNDRILEYDPSSLRVIARRQISTYIKKIRSDSLDPRAYIREINKLILYEQKNKDKL